MVLASYATIPDFLARYAVTGITSAEVGSVWLQHGTVRTNEALAGYFTTPFTSTNLTARDLCIDFAYLGILMRTRNTEDDAPLAKALKDRVLALTEGGHPMILDDGSTVYPSKARNDAWSSTQGYKPTFDMRDPTFQRVDPDRIDDEWSADS